MSAAWPEPVERVAAFLRDSGAEARLEEFAVETPTAPEAAAAAGCGLDRIVKSLLVTCDEKPVLALVPGDRKGDLRKIAQAVGAQSARVARPDEVTAVTGFEPGAVAPFPLPGVETVVMERTLLRHTLVWAGGGSSRHLVGLSPGELARLTRARPVDAVAPRPYDLDDTKER